MLELQLLGRFRLTAGAADVSLPGTAQRLLAVLAVSGHMSRSRLIGTLWPQYDEARAMGALRTAVWRVHTHGGEAARGALERTRTGLCLGAGVSVDLHRLRESVHAPQEELDVDCGRLCAVSGELLPGWDDEWLVVERERAHQLRLHLLERLAGTLCSRRVFGPALDAALTCLAIDPLRESAHRAVITIHLAEGNVREAGRAYEHCRQLLHDELGVDPTSQTRELAHALAETPVRPS